MLLDFLPFASFFIRECSVPRSSLYNCDCGKTHHDDLRTKSLKIFDDGQFLPKTSLALVELHVARHNNDLCKLLGRCAELPREVASEPLTRRISSVFPRRQSISVRRAEIRWSGREARPGRPRRPRACSPVTSRARGRPSLGCGPVARSSGRQRQTACLPPPGSPPWFPAAPRARRSWRRRPGRPAQCRDRTTLT